MHHKVHESEASLSIGTTWLVRQGMLTFYQRQRCCPNRGGWKVGEIGEVKLVTSTLTARGVESLCDGDLDGLKVLFVAFKEFRSTSVHGCVCV